MRSTTASVSVSAYRSSATICVNLTNSLSVRSGILAGYYLSESEKTGNMDKLKWITEKLMMSLKLTDSES